MTQSPLVAIVDDDAKVLEALADLLESAGFQVCVFNSPLDLLSDSRLGEIDCLITDIAMPEINGVELGERAALVRPELPIFYITGDLEMAALAETNTACSERIFKKPFDSRALLAAVNAAVGARPGYTKP